MSSAILRIVFVLEGGLGSNLFTAAQTELRRIDCVKVNSQARDLILERRLPLVESRKAAKLLKNKPIRIILRKYNMLHNFRSQTPNFLSHFIMAGGQTVNACAKVHREITITVSKVFIFGYKQ